MYCFAVKLIAGGHLRVPMSPENSVVHTWRTMPAVRSSSCNALGPTVSAELCTDPFYPVHAFSNALASRTSAMSTPSVHEP